MQFGAMVLASLDTDEIIDLAIQAEEAGFESFWLNDADIIYRNTWPILAVIARETSRIRFGPCVTNLVTRPWVFICGLMNTLQELSGGRLVVGVGRGDAAVRVVGQRAMSPTAFKSTLVQMRAFLSGADVDLNGTTVRTTVLAARDVPLLGAGYGPVVLRIVGELCDGAIIQAADPELVAWTKRFVDAGAYDAGREPSAVDVTVAAPAFVSEDARRACEKLRWFGDVVSRHVAGLATNSYTDLPGSVTALAKMERRQEGSGPLESVTGDYAHVPDEVVRRIALVGPVETHLEKIRRLEACGVGRVTLYLNHEERYETLGSYARAVIPAMASGRGATAKAVTGNRQHG